MERLLLYALQDAVLSGLACMFYKSPSMLAFQERMMKRFHKNNLQQHFGIINTPKEKRMRELIGTLPLRDMESGTRGRVDKVGVASFPARDVPKAPEQVCA